MNIKLWSQYSAKICYWVSSLSFGSSKTHLSVIYESPELYMISDHMIVFVIIIDKHHDNVNSAYKAHLWGLSFNIRLSEYPFQI